MKILRFTCYSLAALAVVGTGTAQTKIDLDTQAKAIRDVNFSQANSTRPSKTGTALPANCAAGETFLKLDAPAGRNLYVCTATNQWTVQTDGTPPAAPPNANSVLVSNGSGVVWGAFGGDVSGGPQALTVNRISGWAVSPAAPSNGQVLAWSGSAWSPAGIPVPTLNSIFGRIGAVTAQTGDYDFSQIGGTILSRQLPPPSGDLSGSLSAATVSGLQNRPLAATAPAAGQVLTWSGTQWEPEGASGGVTSAFGRTGAVSSQAGDYNFSQIGGTVAASQLPALGGDLSGGAASATVSKLQNRALSAAAPATGQVLTWSGTQWEPQNGAGGITSVFGRSGAIAARSGDYSADQVTNAANLTTANSYSSGARQTMVANATSAGLRVAPTSLPASAQPGDLVVDAADSNQLKVYNGSSWVGTAPAPVHANYAMSFSGQTLLTIAGSTHQLGSANLLVGCYDNSTPANVIEPSTVSVNQTTYDVTVRFPTAQSGRCVINGFASGTGTGSSGGAVSTVFGRTGDIVASSGDYSFGQISGTVANSQVAAGLDAAKIGTGVVSSQVYGYLANVTSDIQAQLEAKAAVSHTHTAGGDVTGALGSTVVTGIQGRSISSAAPTDGQTLTWNASANQWQPKTGAGGGGGAGGAAMAGQLGDFAVTKANPTTLTIGAMCSPATPCNVRFGSRVYSLTSSANATLTNGAGTAFFYISIDGQLTAGHSMTVTCSTGCVSVPGVTSFPVDSIPLYSWDAAAGAWLDSGIDRRSWIDRSTLLAGTGIVVVEAGGQSTVAVDSTLIPTYLKNSVSLDFPRIAAGTCSADLTFTITGAQVGDGVAPGWPSGLESNLVGMMRVSAANQVAVRLCAMGQDVDPASAVFTATIVRGF